MATASIGAQQQPVPPPEEAKVGESKIFSMNLAKKPAERGTLGRNIKLVANHYKIGIKPFQVSQYDLSLERLTASGEIDPKRDRDRDLKDKDFTKYAVLIRLCT